MWLRLIALSIPHAAFAGETASARLDAFDDGWITVVTPAVSLAVEEPTWTAVATGSLDVLSGATPVLVVDAVSTATPFDEKRLDGSLTLTSHPEPEWSLGAHLFGSHEADDRTFAGGLSASGEVIDRRLQLDAVYTVTDRRTAMVRGDARTERSLGHDLSLGVTLIASRSTVLGTRLALGGQWCAESLGCAPSAYRYVGLLRDGEAPVVVAERHPETRHHLALSARVAQAVGDHVGLHAAVRGYSDSWSTLAVTGSAGASWTGFDDRLLVGMSGRVTSQSATGFYQTSYAVTDGEVPQWTTADRELSGVGNRGLTGRATWTWFGVGPWVRVVGSARLSPMWRAYPTFGPESSRRAVASGGGVRVQR